MEITQKHILILYNSQLIDVSRLAKQFQRTPENSRSLSSSYTIHTLIFNLTLKRKRDITHVLYRKLVRFALHFLISMLILILSPDPTSDKILQLQRNAD